MLSFRIWHSCVVFDRLTHAEASAQLPPLTLLPKHYERVWTGEAWARVASGPGAVGLHLELPVQTHQLLAENRLCPLFARF